MTDTTQIKELCKKLNESGLKAKIWKGSRVYINGIGKDMTIYIELNNPEDRQFDSLYSGCSLKVYTNCEQSIAWKMARCKQMKHFIAMHLYHSRIVHVAPPEDWHDMEL